MEGLAITGRGPDAAGVALRVSVHLVGGTAHGRRPRLRRVSRLLAANGSSRQRRKVRAADAPVRPAHGPSNGDHRNG